MKQFLTKKNLVCLILTILSLVLISSILFKTLFFNYQTTYNNELNSYYKEPSNINVENLNRLINRYKNDSNKINKITSLTDSKIKDWINIFNTAYDSSSSLNLASSDLKNKITNLIGNIHLSLFNNENQYLASIVELTNSKEHYFNALTCQDATNYIAAVKEYNLVISKDSYYQASQNNIDKSIKITINNLVSTLATEESNASTDLTKRLELFLSLYEKILSSSTSDFDLTSYQDYKDLKKTYQTKLVDAYLNLAKSYANNDNYPEAIKTLQEGLKILTKYEINASNLTALKDEYESFLPADLTSLDMTTIAGSSFKISKAVTDQDNVTYPTAILFNRPTAVIYEKNIITFNLNGAYKNLSGIINIVYGVNNLKDTTQIKIYGDDKLLFTSNYFKSGSKKQSFSLDVNNIKELKITGTINYYKNSLNNQIYDNILIGSPVLTKY